MKEKTLYAGQFLSWAYCGGISEWGTFSASGIASLEEACERLDDGGVCIDKRALGEEGIAMVYSGPMHSVRLPPRTIQVFGSEPKTFSTVEAALLDSDTMRSLTYVSLDIDAEIWRRLGARIGKKVDRRMVWET